jgi:hypothetical protein
MNQTLSAAVQALTPPILWNAMQRLRRLQGRHPWREFGQMSTCADAAPLLTGIFADLYNRYRTLDPFETSDRWRYRLYNVCMFAEACRGIPGDFVIAGVSWGVAPRIVYDYVDLSNLGKKLHLIDPFEGIVANDSTAVSSRYNCDPDYVLRQYPADAPVVLHRERIPMRLPGPFAFVSTDTGNPRADAQALPIFYEALSPGGVFITEQYANNADVYHDALRQIGVTPLWLPSGQGVIWKR